MARRWSVAPLLAAGMALTAAPAAADTLSALRSDKVVEKAHTITVALGRGHAKLTVRRTLHNGGDRHDQATIAIEVPTDAVATGLRTQGMVNGVPQWFAAELLEAERAAAKYKELTGIGGAYPKDPALLSWRQPGLYWLQVFPVGPNEDKTVEYTLRLPTSYAQGRDVLHLPALGTADRKAEIHVEPALGSDRVRVTPDEDGGFDAELTRGSAKPIEGALAVVPFGPGRVLMRQRFEAAAKLGEVPRGARVVVVMDASRSVDTARAHAQVLAARAYLQHFPDAEVETLLFDRKVTALHGRLVPVKDAIASLEKLTITGRNGSNVDEALARAGALLASAPGRAAKRVLVLTDTVVRSSLRGERLRALAAATGAVVHVGVMHAGSPSLARDDGHAWDRVVRPTGGLVWAAGADEDEAPMRDTFEEWARPKRIDHVRVTIPGLDATAFKYPKVLDEGEGFDAMEIVGKRVGFLGIAGQLWSTPVRATLVPDEEEGRVTAALAFGAELAKGLSEPEMMVLAKVGHAVSPVTSLLAVEPGVRPSTEGIDRNMWGDEISDSFGAAGLGLMGIGEGGGGAGPEPDRNAWLRDQLAPAWKTCGGGARHAQVRIETTYDEVVDVDRPAVANDRAGTLSRCLEEAAWGIDLAAMFREPRASYTIDL